MTTHAMTTAPPQKMTLNQLRAQMQVFLDFRDVEHTLQADVDRDVGEFIAPRNGRSPLDRRPILHFIPFMV